MKQIMIILFVSLSFQLHSQTVIRGAKWGDSPTVIKSIERAPLISESDFENKAFNRMEYTLKYSVTIYDREATLTYTFNNQRLSNICYMIEIEPIWLLLFHNEFDFIVSEFARKYGPYKNAGKIIYENTQKNWEGIDSALKENEKYYFEDNTWHDNSVNLNFPSDYSFINVSLIYKPKGKNRQTFNFNSKIVFTIDYIPNRWYIPDF